MSKRSRPDGPCRTKATYHHKRPKYVPPSPDRITAAENLKAIECAKDRAFNRLSSEERVANLMNSINSILAKEEQ
jgi:hypothetical protein